MAVMSWSCSVQGAESHKSREGLSSMTAQSVERDRDL